MTEKSPVREQLQPLGLEPEQMTGENDELSVPDVVVPSIRVPEDSELIVNVAVMTERQRQANDISRWFVYLLVGGLGLLLVSAQLVIFGVAGGNAETWSLVFDRFWTAMTLILGFLLGHYFPHAKK